MSLLLILLILGVSKMWVHMETLTVVASSCTNDVTCIGTWPDRIPGLISSNRTCWKHKAKPTMYNFPFWGNDWRNYWNHGSKHSPQKSFNSWRMCAVSHFMYALTIMSSWSEQELETGRSLLESKQKREMIVHFCGPPFELRVKPKLYMVGSSWWYTGVCCLNTLSNWCRLQEYSFSFLHDKQRLWVLMMCTHQI